jgi:hypothetical protein
MSRKSRKQPDDGPAGDDACPLSPDKSGHSPDEGAGAASAATGCSFVPDGLTPKQGQAIDALLREPTLARAAAAAGVNDRTLRRWLVEPAFRSALLAARREAFGQAIGLTQRYAPVAVATLVKVMNDASAAASAKVTAAGVLLRFGREGIELDDLAERVDALERAAKAAGGVE